MLMKDSTMLKIDNLKQNVLNSKKYWLVFLLLIFTAVISIFNIENYYHPKFEIAILVLISIISIFSISYYHNVAILSYTSWLL